MDSIIDRVGPCLLGHQTDRGGPAPDHYGALVRSIVGQQVSVAAARSMLARLHDRFGGRTPSPGQILADDPEELRAAAGLSRSKARFLRDLAEAVDSGTLVLEELDELPDEDVAERLIQVRGIGQWTVDMFLIFHLGRPDVLPVGDLGLRRAARAGLRPAQAAGAPAPDCGWPAPGAPGARWPPGTSGPRCVSSPRSRSRP